MLFLFAGVTVASTDGLAYCIALRRRRMALDVIIPYVSCVALLLELELILPLERASHGERLEDTSGVEPSRAPF